LTEEGSPTVSLDRSPVILDDANESEVEESVSSDVQDFDDNAADDDDGFGDFDEFEEGGEGDDFGDFDDGFQQGEQETETSFEKPPDQIPVPAPSIGPVSHDYLAQTQLAMLCRWSNPSSDTPSFSPYLTSTT
jgi:hypothetical protein